MRKKLAIVQICGLFIAGILTRIDGMFKWHAFNTMFTYNSVKDMSLDNLMTVQCIGGGPMLYYLFYIALIATVVYCVAQLFSNHRLWSNKVMIMLPLASFLITAVMVIACDRYHESYKYDGEWRTISVSLETLAYVLLAVLGAVVIIEFYKQFKCNES